MAVRSWRKRIAATFTSAALAIGTY